MTATPPIRTDVLVEDARCHVCAGVFPSQGVYQATLALEDGKVIESSADLASYILDKAEVAVVPGEAFGSPGYLRLSFARRHKRTD